MALYMRITRAEDSQDESVKPLAEGRARHPAALHPDHDRAVALAAKLGFEVIAEWLPYKPQDWPLTAVVYTTTPRGGRSSQCYRMPCRKITNPSKRAT